MSSDELQLIALDGEDCPPPPWPRSGQRFHLIVEVEHIGKHWDDELEPKLLWCPEEVAGLFYDHDFEMLGLHLKAHLPIASGIYVLTVEYFYDKWTSMESWTPEIDYGLYLLSLVRFQ